MQRVEIDEGSGFCFGVTTAIRKAEEELAKGETLYCLGDIVHNGQECERLEKLGLVTINHEEFAKLKHAKVLLRAHGEPPETYQLAKENHIEIIDATCPVVLQLQKRIKQEYNATPADREKQIVIYGKNGHAEVLGLVGQTEGKAIVIEKLEEVHKLDFNKDIRLYSQTTKSLDEFRQIVAYIEEHIAPTATFQYFDTICRQVANRMPNIRRFAAAHDLIFFCLRPQKFQRKNPLRGMQESQPEFLSDRPAGGNRPETDSEYRINRHLRSDFHPQMADGSLQKSNQGRRVRIMIKTMIKKDVFYHTITGNFIHLHQVKIK